jgi:hypothetical protein
VEYPEERDKTGFYGPCYIKGRGGHVSLLGGEEVQEAVNRNSQLASEPGRTQLNK